MKIVGHFCPRCSAVARVKEACRTTVYTRLIWRVQTRQRLCTWRTKLQIKGRSVYLGATSHLRSPQWAWWNSRRRLDKYATRMPFKCWILRVRGSRSWMRVWRDRRSLLPRQLGQISILKCVNLSIRLIRDRSVARVQTTLDRRKSYHRPVKLLKNPAH